MHDYYNNTLLAAPHCARFVPFAEGIHNNDSNNNMLQLINIIIMHSHG